jgi:putative ABC transport system ATP-binding protein
MKRYPPEVVQQFQDLAAELRSRTVQGHPMGICDDAMMCRRPWSPNTGMEQSQRFLSASCLRSSLMESTSDHEDGNSCSSRTQIGSGRIVSAVDRCAEGPMSAGGFRLEQVTVTRGPATLLAQFSAGIPAGRCTAVTGASGAGKSTLLRLLNRLAEPTTGSITLDGVPLPELDVLGLRRRVGLVAQTPVLLTGRVIDEVRVGRENLPEAGGVELLTRVGLAPSLTERATAELSGGEVQRLCLARALAVEPDMLLLDEPTSALDEASAEVIGALIEDYVSAGGTVVLVSHDHGLIDSLAAQVLVLEHGHLVARGSPAELDVSTAS